MLFTHSENMNEAEPEWTRRDAAIEMGRVARDIQWLANVCGVKPPIESDIILDASMRDWIVAQHRAPLSRERIEKHWDDMFDDIYEQIQDKKTHPDEKIA